MATKPFLDERRLSRALKGQGFTLRPTTSGTVVVGPNGGTAAFHPSVFNEGNAVAYRNMIGQLTRMGFNLNMVKAPKTRDEKWRVERAELEAMITSQEPEPEPEVVAEPTPQVAPTGLTHVEEQTLDAIRAEPGLSPAEYAARLGIEHHAFSQRTKRLRRTGMIRATGATSSTRYYLGDGTPPPPSDRARSGPVRVRQITPADPVIRYRRLVEQATKAATTLAELFPQMVEAYGQQQTELNEKAKRLAALETILSRAVDRL